MTRTFSITEAKREAVPLLIGLVGPSGGGKTGSALELAHGIQEVVGGDIGGIDTEANRMKHYAGAEMFSDPKRQFKFKHLPFGAPFNPDSYKQAIEAMIKMGVKTVIVDSMSHEHEGPGGVLEMHEADLDKFSRGDEAMRDKNNLRAWARPKQERRMLINFLLQQPVNFIFCFRAKEKIKPAKAGQKGMDNQGWQPIAGEEFVFEMTLNCLLLPNANGVPTWNPDEKAEKLMIKLPKYFREIVTPGRVLSAAMGKELALWAKGGEPSKPKDSDKGGHDVKFPSLGDPTILLPLTQSLQQATSLDDLNTRYGAVNKAKKEGKLTPENVGSLEQTWREVRDHLAGNSL